MVFPGYDIGPQYGAYGSNAGPSNYPIQPLDPRMGTPLSPRQGTPLSPRQGIPLDPRLVTPWNPGQGTPLNPGVSTPSQLPESNAQSASQQGQTEGRASYNWSNQNPNDNSEHPSRTG